jgi:hypothetical protein
MANCQEDINMLLFYNFSFFVPNIIKKRNRLQEKNQKKYIKTQKAYIPFFRPH